MSLEVVDIQEVMHQVAEGKLVRVNVKESEVESAVRMIETMDFGDVSLWSEDKLFKIEKALLLPENNQLRKRWNQAIEINTKIRMNKLRCKALDMLETYNNEYKATDIAYCKTVLSGVLAEDTAAARAKYLTPKQEDGEMTTEDQDEMDNLRDQL